MLVSDEQLEAFRESLVALLPACHSYSSNAREHAREYLNIASYIAEIVGIDVNFDADYTWVTVKPHEETSLKNP